MTLLRRSPFSDLSRDFETLDRFLNRAFIPWEGKVEAEAMTTPALELENTENAVIVRAELPGIDPKDLDIEVTADRVSMRGERRQESRSEEKGVLRTEFSYGSFERAVRLPARVDNAAVKAEYKDGILTLTLPKHPEELNKVVKVDVKNLIPAQEVEATSTTS
jgi:HSP20 family protein